MSTAANVKQVEPWAGSKRRKELDRGFRCPLQKLSTGSIEEVHKKAWILGAVDLYPSVDEGR
jgi:hypothetical protein